jgi:hypothetical protein
MPELYARPSRGPARVGKKIINLDRGGTYVVCAWDECDRDASDLHTVRAHEHAQSIPCASPMARHITYPFCTERHRQYWLNATGDMAKESAARNNGRQYGMLPEGMRNVL